MIGSPRTRATSALEVTIVPSLTCPPPCEATLTADTEDELVEKAQDHAQTVHGEVISREEILKYVN
jgi:predicted small metal-binding protein